MDIPRIKYVEPLSNYKLFVIFENGEIKVYLMKDLLKEFPFNALKEENMFFEAKLDKNGYGVVWNDDIDLSEYEIWKNGVLVSSITDLAHKIESEYP